MEIVKKSSLKVIGLEINTTEKYVLTELPHGWKKFFKNYKGISNRIDNRFMDIRVKKDDKFFTHLLCVEVIDFLKIPEGMVAKEFPESEYLQLNYEGHLLNISLAFDKMNKWALENGYVSEDFRIDYGYFEADSSPTEHSLLIRVI